MLLFSFGSTVVGDMTGIIYNCQMDDFSSPNITNHWGLYPSPANFIKPGKRPLSSMSPLVVVNKDGDVELVVGASGGSAIITSLPFVSINLDLVIHVQPRYMYIFGK